MLRRPRKKTIFSLNFPSSMKKQILTLCLILPGLFGFAHLSRETPFLLPPNGSFPVRIKLRGSQDSGSATLFVKITGKAAPLEIKVTRK